MMELAGTRGFDFRKLADFAASDTDRRERITESLAWHLQDFIPGDRAEYDVGANLFKSTSGGFVFEGQDVLGQSFEHDEVIDALWEACEEVQDRLGFETILVDDWTVEFREVA